MSFSSTLGIASSVASEQQFDVRVALSYALEHHFAGFQAYLNQQVLTDPSLREQIRVTCSHHHLDLLLHAPATLNMSTLENFPVPETHSLFPPSQPPLVVHHYDETVSFEESLTCLHQIQDRGLIPCLENYFQGAERGERCFSSYLHLLRSAQRAGISVRPVFDIPRLYHEMPPQQALSWVEVAFETFAQLQTPLILHLIDVMETNQQRGSWCPIGQGLIPYADIFQRLRRQHLPHVSIILEYEDRSNPLLSKAFLHTHLGTPLA